MSLTKIFNDNAWREFHTDPVLVPLSNPAFPPGEVDYVFPVGSISFTLSPAVKSGSLSPTYTVSGLPTGLTASGLTISGSISTAITKDPFTVIATYSDGKSVSKGYTITTYHTATSTLSTKATNVQVSNPVWITENGIVKLKTLTITWDDPPNTALVARVRVGGSLVPIIGVGNRYRTIDFWHTAFRSTVGETNLGVETLTPQEITYRKRYGGHQHLAPRDRFLIVVHSINNSGGSDIFSDPIYYVLPEPYLE